MNNRLDEMQLAKKSRIGSQCFALLVLALFADALLYGMGIEWIRYPNNTLLIVSAVMIIHVVRLIKNNAFWPDAQKYSKKRLAAWFVTALVFGGGGAVISQRDQELAAVLIALAAAAVTLSIILFLVIHYRNRNDSDD